MYHLDQLHAFHPYSVSVNEQYSAYFISIQLQIRMYIMNDIIMIFIFFLLICFLCHRCLCMANYYIYMTQKRFGFTFSLNSTFRIAEENIVRSHHAYKMKHSDEGIFMTLYFHVVQYYIFVSKETSSWNSSLDKYSVLT